MSENQCTVVVVDDDFMVARIHRGFVERMDGFRVVGEAHTGADALAAVTRLRPDIVLLDIYLPDISGLEVLERLRTGDHADTGVIVVTAARDIETVSRSLQLGAGHFLIKPFGRDDLARSMWEVRDQRRRLAAAGEDIHQREVDRLFKPGTPSREAPLPKGLSQVTMDAVVAEVSSCAGNCSASEVAERLGLSRVSVRRYLEHLVRVGRISVELRYGDVGRPEHRYRWTGP